jgi:hypothetical protein
MRYPVRRVALRLNLPISAVLRRRWLPVRSSVRFVIGAVIGHVPTAQHGGAGGHPTPIQIYQLHAASVLDAALPASLRRVDPHRQRLSIVSRHKHRLHSRGQPF